MSFCRVLLLRWKCLSALPSENASRHSTVASYRTWREGTETGNPVLCHAPISTQRKSGPVTQQPHQSRSPFVLNAFSVYTAVNRLSEVFVILPHCLARSLTKKHQPNQSHRNQSCPKSIGVPGKCLERQHLLPSAHQCPSLR